MLWPITDKNFCIKLAVGFDSPFQSVGIVLHQFGNIDIASFSYPKAFLTDWPDHHDNNHRINRQLESHFTGFLN